MDSELLPKADCRLHTHAAGETGEGSDPAGGRRGLDGGGNPVDRGNRGGAGKQRGSVLSARGDHGDLLDHHHGGGQFGLGEGVQHESGETGCGGACEKRGGEGGCLAHATRAGGGACRWWLPAWRRRWHGAGQRRRGTAASLPGTDFRCQTRWARCRRTS